MTVSLNSGGGKEVLTAARTYFVETTGNDSNDGLTVPTAFLTIQKAVDTWEELDNAGFPVTIQVGAGTYTIGTTINIVTGLGGGQLIILGDAVTPTNCVLTDGGAMIGLFDYSGSEAGYLKVQGFYVHDGGGNTTVGLVQAFNHKTIVVSDIHWGDADFFSGIVFANNYCNITFEGANVISGSSIDTLCSVRDHCKLELTGTVDVTGSPFGSNFVDAQNHSNLRTSSITLTVTNPGGGFWSLGAFLNEWSFYDVTVGDPLLVIGAAQAQNGSQYSTSSVGMASLGNGVATSSVNLDELRFDNNTIANSVGIQVDTVAGVPSSTPNDGTLAVDTSNNDLYFRSSSAWVQANGGGGGGETYFVDNYGGGVPTAAGTDALAIGQISSAAGQQAVAIGDNAIASGEHSIAIGAQAQALVDADTIAIGEVAIASGPQGIAIGHNTTSGSGIDNLSIGSAAIGSVGNNNISIGNVSNPGGGDDGIAIGNAATIAFQNRNIAIGQGASVTGGATADAIVIGAGATCNGPGAIAIGDGANGNNSATVCIGDGATTNGASAVAVGLNSGGNGTSSGAIGNGAIVSANFAYQIGGGTNSTASTIQFFSNTIANDTSIEATTQATGVAPTSTPRDGTIIVDENGTGTLWVRVAGTWRSVGLT